MPQKAADQITLVDLTDAYSVILTSEASTIPGTTTNAIQTSVTTTVVAMRGDEQMTATVAAGSILTPTGVTAAVNANSGSPIVTITVGSSVTASGVVRIPVVIGDLTIWKEFSFSLALRGATGAAGKGITSAAVTYQASSSGTTAPTGTWVASPPALTPGQYLWTRTITTYTDASTTTAYSVGQAGSSGGKGDKGDNGATSYFHVAYATNATGTTGFSTTDPSGKTYMGTYTDLVAADSTDPTKYEWVLIKGETGGTGKGIASTAVTYQAGTSGTVAPTGSWVAAVPAVADGQFLWTRTIITFSDNATQTSYAVAKQGEKGQQGDQGAPGADAITLSVTSSAGLIFKNSDIVTTLTATVYRAGAELTSAQVAELGTVRWYKDGNTTAVATGLTLSITAGQVTNRATYMAQLES